MEIFLQEILLEREFLKSCTEIINNNWQNEPIINATLRTIKK